jgi:hypothetical protein
MDMRSRGTERFTTVGGIAMITGALLAIAGNAIVLAAHPNVPAHVVSYPLSPHDFRLG